MSGAFQYRPKFVDIRVRPPKEGEAEREADVHVLGPGERRCDHPGCLAAAAARAPKSRRMMEEHYWFCRSHAAEYNKGWDFFAGMSEGQIRAHQEAAFTGERPTWPFKASRFSREAASFAAGAGRMADAFGLFRGGGRRAPPEGESERRLGRIERGALADLDLPEAATAPEIRARYTELVKLCHPDANDGDRSAEQKLQKVLKAFKALRKARMV